MTVNKDRKVKRYRGSKTHGCGSMKKRRGAGNRGGRGNAGTGKRGDAKKPVIWKDKKYFGKHGFKKKGAVNNPKTISLFDIDQKVAGWVLKGKAEEKSGIFVIDLSKVGYSKILGQGKVNKKFDIKVDMCSKSAIEKLKNAGCKINVLQGSSAEEETVTQEKPEEPKQEKAEETQKED